MKIISDLFDKKRNRKLTADEKKMCASVVAVCALVVVLVFVVRALAA